MHGGTHHLTGSCSDVYGDNSLVATVFCPSTDCLHAAQTTMHLQGMFGKRPFAQSCLQ